MRTNSNSCNAFPVAKSGTPIEIRSAQTSPRLGDYTTSTNMAMVAQVQ